MKWKDKQYTCSQCGLPRRAGNTLCADCRKAERAERYASDPYYRRAAKEVYNRWREDSLEARAAYMREWRAKQKATRSEVPQKHPEE